MSDQNVLMRKSPHGDKRYNKRYDKSKNYNKKHRMSKRKRIAIICIVIVCAILAAGAVFVGSLILNSRTYNANTMFQKKENAAVASAMVQPETEEPEQANDPNLIVFGGEQYRYNEDIINVLFMGVDYTQNMGEHGEVLNGGQADTLVLLSINTKTNKITMLNIPRDAMTKIDIYDLNKQFTGTKVAQIALSHAYGDGAELSDALSVKAVSNLFYGLPIYRYIRLNIAGVPDAVDLMGGIDVTLAQEDTIDGKKYKAGEQVHLNGASAKRYVQQRDSDVMDSNLGRMTRQTSFLKSFFEAMKGKMKENPLFPVTLYQQIGQYAFSDMSLTEMAYVARMALESGLKDENIFTVPGNMQQGEVFAEYIVEEEALYQMILDTFYLKEPAQTQE